MINDILKKINKAHEVESSKVELAKHEVQLGLAEDVKAAYKNAIDARKKSFDEYQKLKPIIASALKVQLDLRKINEDAIAIYNKYEEAAKQLGLALPDNIKGEKENIQGGLKGTFVQYVKALQSIKL